MPYKDPEKQRQYQRERLAKARQDWLLANGPCVVCGSWDDLEVDHIDPATKVAHSVWSWGEAKRLIELAKCQVLCYTHHLEKTLVQRRKTSHGTGQMYSVHKCRCSECSNWKRNDNAKRN